MREIRYTYNTDNENDRENKRRRTIRPDTGPGLQACLQFTGGYLTDDLTRMEPVDTARMNKHGLGSSPMVLPRSMGEGAREVNGELSRLNLRDLSDSQRRFRIARTNRILTKCLG